VKAACHRINMSQVGAYYLRRQPGAEEFRAAWNAALDFGVQSLVDIAIDRAKEGVPVPVFYRGAQVGERRWYNDRLLMFILKHHMPNKYGLNLSPGTKHPDTLAREAEEEGEEALDRVRERLARLRESIDREFATRRAERAQAAYDRYAHDPAKRAAWETLHGRAIETLLDPPPALTQQVLEQGGPDQWTLTEDWLHEPPEDD
jgi:hypothetical protein